MCLIVMKIRYYKEKVIYEDIFSVPIIQNTYKSYRVKKKNWGGGGGAILYSLYSIKTIMPMESPRKPSKTTCVCVCVSLSV